MEAGHSRILRWLNRVRVLKPAAPPEGYFDYENVLDRNPKG
jgi:hypothetical protein